ncbi:hypothetical protein H6G54_01525 [Anabaena cylindrica FACHB-243]|uniref:Uncharacterized protein n=1 Tax=Anabaena cylindrica (strain ATCC 27899 / PCC 7122) TaxID=272123 RepID=K9ZMJ7_ANACC|nr:MULTISPECIES: hypothetical protein [Anabaena]AFZ60426.1 hypothetical protein Anacy_5090 [Anabaena cylindrica PCC 7122]MBD2416414.1 hypothetical protein [Anabaena cylindrica FACHB-243]MBY5280556.1 hypothetical protein [Anabaena sp. CCAP 1446/1C]MBY5309041.1 hypothetical protein [Anabaena sp. CCAP 1446/1C]MCM2408467.1 hypothetical protein [Anabaena sp. CCAP 1446/1C]
MKQLKEAVRQAIAQGNWYAALASALTLPDICGWLEYPNKGVGDRYRLWYDTYIKGEYSGKYNDSDKVEVILLSGNDCYALRCAYLHNGQDDITNQKASKSLKSLNKFIFVTPSKSGESSKHPVRTTYFDDDGNIRFEELRLEVDEFCEHICCGVDKWEVDVAKRDDIQERIKKLSIIVES